MSSRLKETYTNEIVDAMIKKFGYKNIMEVPKLDKVVVNMGVGEAKENAKVLDSSQLNCDHVQMLNTVKVENLANHRVMEFTIVGESEADFSKGKLAATTPIGKALMGHSKGEVVEAKVPSGVMQFKILDITF